VVERHRAVLEVLGDPGRIIHVGGHGTGYAVKLVMNLLWFGQAVATTEALLLGQRTGIDPAVLRQALLGSPAASTLIRRDIGLVFRGDYLASFGLDRICEELEAVTALAGDYQVPWELSDVVRQTYRHALDRFGPVDGDLLAVSLLEDEAGDKLRTAHSSYETALSTFAGTVISCWCESCQAPHAPGTLAAAAGGAGLLGSGLWLVLVALLLLTLADVLFRGVDSTVDLLVVLMVSVALGELRYFVDPFVGLLRVLLGVGLRLLLQVAEFAHVNLLSHRAGPAARPRSGAPTLAPGTDAQAHRGIRARRAATASAISAASYVIWPDATWKRPS
jgi:NAD-binding of NADP-dependent 3-hydroxyisobutyrate dehydrogenase